MLEKARAVFWNQGYAATSLDDLVAATGLNRPSLYAAFGDKRAMYLAALGRTRDEALASLRRGLSADRPLRDVIASILERANEVYQAGDLAQRGCFVTGTAITQSVEDPEVRAIAAGFIDATEALYRARFEKDADQLAPGVRPAAAAAMITATMHTLSVRARTGAAREALKRVADAALEMLFPP
ncbi:TetR/AcrR family transcriptional regulator [Phenylobacterium sp. J426]|uniref:TetR/AcrR family transcriptional regulator n=1 Tax=Phenylobacterium sp. J426 TaxID=2898439 RepID=UPI002151AC08|nr:TetR/AcrR family transcriptional regulator [Phenylobacterium sp. J426]MCR5874028.1 TetR/AcrR family transcriptional regulator [Phenylobacterium sp. J426]